MKPSINTISAATATVGTSGLGDRVPSAVAISAMDEEDDNSFQQGPRYTLKEQLEKDKDDESLRRWKEQLLGDVDINNVGESADPEVKITSLSILSPGRPADLQTCHCSSHSRRSKERIFVFTESPL